MAMDDQPTGNPVFTHRLAWRQRALAWQWRLLKAGALLFLATPALIWCLPMAWWVAWLAGWSLSAVLLAAGLWWGAHWRQELKRSFRAEHGAFDPGQPPA
jgi:hypothetical protein